MEPYKGLRPYEESDRDNFFGREAEKQVLVDKILTNKLSLLFAASGVGKSSLLQAAVLPELKRADGENLDVVYCRDWVQDPLATLKQHIVEALSQRGRLDESLNLDAPLREFLRLCTLFSSEPLVLVLDQFEEFFNYQRYGPHFKPFVKQLAAAVLDRDAATAFVFSMREDFALELNAFKPELPTLLFENFYRLEKLDRERAKQAIAEPVEHLGYAYEEGLLDRLLDDLSRREQIERFGASAAATLDAPPVVEPPHLQIVCMQLWEADKNNPEKIIRAVTYHQKGNAAGLLNSYFENEIKLLSASEIKLVSMAFDYLVSGYGTKIAYPLRDLAFKLKQPENTTEKVLNKLEKSRILRKYTSQGITWYELYHDIFSEKIEAWNGAYKEYRAQKSITPVALTFAVLLQIIIFVLSYLGSFQTVELVAYDFMLNRYAQSFEPDERITLLLCNDEDQSRYGWPLSDAVLADVFEYLLKHEPRAIGLNLYRDRPVPSGGADFERLSDIFRNNSSIIAIANIFRPIEPPPALKGTDQIGFNDLITDPQGFVRRGLLFAGDDEKTSSYFGLELAAIYLGKDGLSLYGDDAGFLRIGRAKYSFTPLTPDFGGYTNIDAAGYQFTIDYPGAPKGFNSLNVSELLAGEFDPEILKDKIILIGTNAEATPDFFYTPLQKDRVPATEVHAYAISQFLRIANNELQPIQSWGVVTSRAWLVAWMLFGLLAILFWNRSFWLVIFFGIIGLIGTLVIPYSLFFINRLWVLSATPTISVSFSILLMVLSRVYYKAMKKFSVR